MDLLAQLGAKRIAAPPAGARGTVDPMAAAKRYRALLEIGDEIGVVPQIEMWGGNPSIGRVSTAIYIAIEAGHPSACFLGDVYHTYKGGSDFAGLKMLGPQALQHFHWNDYPADPPLEKIGDQHRVFPGDGIAPIADIVKGFLQVGAMPVLSLELFNRDYWAMDALEAARIGLDKMKASVAPAL
jgi:sugar phosphate isomerase/epimerase